jgi:hypothetical protein
MFINYLYTKFQVASSNGSFVIANKSKTNYTVLETGCVTLKPFIKHKLIKL